ncbi:MAG: M23 family metallopeptidase [Treponema sp.]|jgi:murein DD-endopeptidase MepM/ murein hydrolase activator NlpD|nr:M23 family metallopeptidase [Treponema sp.]
MMLIHNKSRLGLFCTNIFRLVCILYLAFLVLPDRIKLLHIASAAEYGIGGGVIFEEDLLDQLSQINSETLEILESLEVDTLSRSRALFYDSYKVQRGENISGLAINLGLNQDSIISVNKITNTRLLQTGRVLLIPNQDGILHTIRNGETLSAIAERYKVEQNVIQTANELFSDTISVGADLFIPGAKLDWIRLQEINGDLFIWPVRGVITSGYGYRRDPFNSGRRQFHTGIDIRGSHGTPVRSAMSGRVSQVGSDRVLGNYVIISHHSGYRTLYAHLSVIRTRTGAYVAAGERIGDVGSTGLSTGSHLHFTVYKNGVTVNPRTLLR